MKITIPSRTTAMVYVPQTGVCGLFGTAEKFLKIDDSLFQYLPQIRGQVGSDIGLVYTQSMIFPSEYLESPGQAIRNISEKWGLSGREAFLLLLIGEVELTEVSQVEIEIELEGSSVSSPKVFACPEEVGTFALITLGGESFSPVVVKMRLWNWIYWDAPFEGLEKIFSFCQNDETNWTKKEDALFIVRMCTDISAPSMTTGDTVQIFSTLNGSAGTTYYCERNGWSVIKDTARSEIWKGWKEN